MNREIKFRGKRVDNGEWVYGYYVCYHVTGGGELFHHIKNPNDTYQIIPETVGQYTGLLDKEGNEIYEGDIWSYNLQYNNYPVEQILNLVKWKEVEGGFSLYEIMIYGPIIIGNIHDNPTLLQK